ncbi:MAG: glycosyltransferase, partial [Spirochaetaceae bacterium]|nr:glycosyltransferase [Spirochaetaceae bacterium]
MKEEEKLKILIIPSWYPSDMDPNGVPFIRGQAQALARFGHDVTVVFTQPYSLKTIVPQKKILLGDRRQAVEGVKEYHTYFPKTHLRRIDELTRLIQGKRIIRKLIKKEGLPQIVHIHTYLAGQLGIWIHKKYGRPLVTTEHYTGFARGIVKPWEMKRARNLYLFSSLNLAVSDAFAQLLKRVTGAPFRQLPNMVNTDIFTLPEKRTDKKDTFTYLFVGLLHSKKNPKMLMESFIKLYREDKTLRLIIAGEGDLEKTLKKTVRENNLQDVVQFPGFLKREQVAEYMKKADAFVLPSRFETFGIVVIEAMASGLPVIVTISGGPESFVINGENGFIIDQDLNHLERAMKAIKGKEWDTDSIRRYVMDNFSEKAIVEKLIDEYRKVLNDREILQASREISVSGGISKVAFQLAKHLTSTGYPIITLTTDIDELSSLENIGRIFILPMPRWIKKLPVYLRNYFKTKVFTKKVHSIFKYRNKNPHCITISHRDSYGANIAIGHSCHREAIELKRKEGHLLWWLNPIHLFYLGQEKAICRKPYPHLAAISKSIADEYHRHYKLPENFIHTIPNGVDTERFYPDSDDQDHRRLIKELFVDKDSFIILFVGNEFKRKGLDFLIEALSLIADNNIHLVVLGGADPSPYRPIVRKMKREKQVHF